MKTTIKVLYFLNKLNFAGHLENVEYEKLDCVRAVLTDEFQDVNSEKLINLLGVLDDLHFLFVNLNFQVVQILSYILRSDISF